MSRARRTGQGGIAVRALAVATAVPPRYLHLNDAYLDTAGGTSILGQATLLRAEAVAALVVAVALPIRPHPVVRAVAVLVAGSGAGAVLLYT
jgi:hypothetical protein